MNHVVMTTTDNNESTPGKTLLELTGATKMAWVKPSRTRTDPKDKDKDLTRRTRTRINITAQTWSTGQDSEATFIQ